MNRFDTTLEIYKTLMYKVFQRIVADELSAIGLS